MSQEPTNGAPRDVIVITAPLSETAVLDDCTHDDPLVVGARGDSFVARAVRGSVSERLVARTPCDLFIAR